MLIAGKDIILYKPKISVMSDVRSIFNTRPPWVSVSTKIVKERRAKQRLGKEQWEERNVTVNDAGSHVD